MPTAPRIPQDPDAEPDESGSDTGPDLGGAPEPTFSQVDADTSEISEAADEE